MWWVKKANCRREDVEACVPFFICIIGEIQTSASRLFWSLSAENHKVLKMVAGTVLLLCRFSKRFKSKKAKLVSPGENLQGRVGGAGLTELPSGPWCSFCFPPLGRLCDLECASLSWSHLISQAPQAVLCHSRGNWDTDEGKLADGWPCYPGTNKGLWED